MVALSSVRRAVAPWISAYSDDVTDTSVPLPFGAAEILAAVAGAGRVLDAGCGSGRLTVALAQAGAAVTGIDTNAGQLEQARRRAEEAGVELNLLEADFNASLPFADASFDAVTSRLALMAAADAVATLTELRRVLVPGGRLVTVLWAAPTENPWFALPREAIGAVLGPERASFARAFGKLGDPEEAAAVHRAAGLVGIEAIRVTGTRSARDTASYWQRALGRERPLPPGRGRARRQPGDGARRRPRGAPGALP